MHVELTGSLMLYQLVLWIRPPAHHRVNLLWLLYLNLYFLSLYIWRIRIDCRMLHHHIWVMNIILYSDNLLRISLILTLFGRLILIVQIGIEDELVTEY